MIWLCSQGTPGANRYGLGTSAGIADVFGDGPAPPSGPAIDGLPPAGSVVQPLAAERDAGLHRTI